MKTNKERFEDYNLEKEKDVVLILPELFNKLFDLNLKFRNEYKYYDIPIFFYKRKERIRGKRYKIMNSFYEKFMNREMTKAEYQYFENTPKWIIGLDIKTSLIQRKINNLEKELR